MITKPSGTVRLVSTCTVSCALSRHDAFSRTDWCCLVSASIDSFVGNPWARRSAAPQSNRRRSTAGQSQGSRTATGWPLTEMWVAGALLESSDEIGHGTVVLMIDLPPDELPWLAVHPTAEWVGEHRRCGRHYERGYRAVPRRLRLVRSCVEPASGWRCGATSAAGSARRQPRAPFALVRLERPHCDRGEQPPTPP